MKWLIILLLVVLLYIFRQKSKNVEQKIRSILERNKHKLPNEYLVDLVRMDVTKRAGFIAWFESKGYDLKRRFEFGSVTQLHFFVKPNSGTESIVDLLTGGKDAVAVLAQDKVELDGGSFDDFDSNFVVLFPEQLLQLPDGANILKPCQELRKKGDEKGKPTKSQDGGKSYSSALPRQTAKSNSLRLACRQVFRTKFMISPNGEPLSFIQGIDADTIKVALIDSRTEFAAFAAFEDPLDVTDPYHNYLTDVSNDFSDLNLGVSDEHGTFMASIVAHRFAGSAKLKVRNYPFHDGDSGHIMDLVAAIFSAVDAGVDIINLSLGYQAEKYSTHLRRAINYAGTKNILVVCAAGNLNSDNDENSYWPSNFSSMAHVVSVAAVDNTGSSWTESTSVGTNVGVVSVNFASEGVKIPGMINAVDKMTLSGTSAAAAVISALAANVKSDDMSLKGAGLKSALLAQIDAGTGVFHAPTGLLVA